MRHRFASAAFLLLLLPGACAPGLVERDADGGARSPVDPAPTADGAPRAVTNDAALPRPTDGAPAREAGGTTDPGSPSEAGSVFDDGRLDTYTFTVADADWKKLLATALDEMFVPATLSVSGQEVGKVGLRFKGAYGNLIPCFDRATGKQLCSKVSFKVKFDEYDDKRRFHGLKRVNLHSMLRDPSLLHDRLAYGLFRDMGIVAPRATHARVVINGEYKGLFGLVEAIDGRFTADRWPGAGNGNLYKEAWPNTSSASEYTRKLKTNEDMPVHTKMIAFAEELKRASVADAPKVVDKWANLDYLMRYLAVDRAISNWDGIMGWYCGTPCYNHNFYWYQSEREDRFTLIPWDLDSTMTVSTVFDHVPPWDKPPANCGDRFSLSTGVKVMSAGCDPLIRALVTAGRPAYGKAVAQLLDGPFNVQKIHRDLDRWAAQLQEAVRTDTFGPGLSAWQSAVATLKRDVTRLRERLEYARDGREVPPFGLKPDAANDFEGVSALSFAAGSTSQANTKSNIEITTGSEMPLGGATDVRINFEIRNESETSGWSQWANARIAMLKSSDLSRVRELRIRFKADKVRSVRLNLDSNRYKNASSGILLGWEIPLTASAGVVTLETSKIAIPSWGKSQGDVASDILSSTTGLIFSINPVGRSSAGLYPAGGSDKGSIQIDDIQFVF